MDYTQFYDTIMEQVQQQMAANSESLAAKSQSRPNPVKGLGARATQEAKQMVDKIPQESYNPAEAILKHMMSLKKEEEAIVASEGTGPDTVEDMGHFTGAGVSYGGYNKLLDLLHEHEGGGDPDALFGFSNRKGGRFEGVKPSTMTLGELYAFSDPNGEYGQWVKQKLAESGQDARVATPMGEAQIVGATLRQSAKELGLPDDTVFNRDTQRMIMAHLARKAYQKGGIKGLRKEWEGFKNVPDDILEAAAQEFMANTSVMPIKSPFKERKGR